MATKSCRVRLAPLTVCLALGVAAPGVTVGGLPPLGFAAAQSGSPKGPKKSRGPRAPRGGKGVRQMFDEATKLYEAGKYAAALAAYDALLKRYPGHEPAALQLAKTLYRLDRVKDAYAVFARINPQHLDPETSYEYGWSFYTMKQWEGALYAFQRVPKGHALFDLANYYGGICAIKLRRYEEAGDMLEKAVVLPDKLAKSRALYIKHLQALILMQQRSTLASERLSERGRLEETRRRKVEGGRIVTETSKAGGYVHQGKETVERAARVSHKIRHQYIDHHGFKQRHFDLTESAFDLATGYIFPLPLKLPKDRQAATGFTLALGAVNIITKGREERILIDESTQDLSRVQQQDLGTTDYVAGRVGGGLWLELPLPENNWWALGGSIRFEYPEFNRGLRTGTREAYTRLAGTQAPISYMAQVSYGEVVNPETVPITTIVGAKAVVSSAVLESLTLRGTVEHKLFDYLQQTPPLDGPDTQTSTELWARHALPYGFSIIAAGEYAFGQNHIFNAIPTYGAVAADSSVVTGKLTLAAEPLPWLGLLVTQRVAKTTWAIDNEDAREPFEITVPDYIEDFSASITVNLAF